MGEIGGYIELWENTGPMLHDGAIALNCGKNALAYLIEARGIKKIALPWYLCNSLSDICLQYDVTVRHYPIGSNFRVGGVMLEEDEWMVIVNYYGQIDNNSIRDLYKQHRRVIVDNTQAYFQMPVPGVDTLYSCRKFFGVPDGAFLYTEAHIERELKRDESRDRIRHLVGRYEKSASEFYPDYITNEKQFEDMPLRRMSKLTENMLRGIDYTLAKQKRVDNFRYLHSVLAKRNRLQLTVPDGPFMYPFWVDNGIELRRSLQKQKIYIPTLWPDVLDSCAQDTLEYDLAANILPLPVDQRYGQQEMDQIIKALI